MDSTIECFLNSFKNWSQNFSVQMYEYSQYQCEVAQIMKMQLDNNTEGLIKIWDNILKQECFELFHPLYNNIKTRAVYNFYDNESTNYVFMIDQNNENFWILKQNSHFINAFIVPGRIFGIFSWWGYELTQDISNINSSFLYYHKAKYGFLLSNRLPQHFFNQVLSSYYALSVNIKGFDKIPIYSKDIFFKFNNFILNDGLDLYIYPNLNAGFHHYIKEMKKEICYQSINDKEILFDKNIEYDLVLWIGLCSANYRKWVEQEEGIIKIIQELSKYFNKILIYFDGVTSYDEMRMTVLNSSFEKIKKEIVKMNSNYFKCKIIYLGGLDYKTKINYCSFADIAICEGNTTNLIPFHFCNTPGVNFIPPDIDWAPKVGTINIEKKYIKISINSKNDRPGTNDYHIPYECIYNSLAEILERIKNIKMHRLTITPVELLAEKYCLEEKYKIKLKIKSNEIFSGDRIFNNFKTAKSRIQNHLSYKLGQALIANSKSLWGYIRMPFVLSYIKDKHRQEQKVYEEKIKENPNLVLPPLESYPDYQEALKEKECFTYKLGQVLMEADKEWYKGGYIRILFKIRKLKYKVSNRKE
ncbi:TPA: hypothetical protein ACH6IR_000433 [Campylobacter jejuni]